MENPSEALPLIKESLDGRRQTLGDDHINTLNSISLLSEVYADMRVRPKPRQNNRFSKHRLLFVVRSGMLSCFYMDVL